MNKIIVAVDGSEHSMRAVEKAKEIGKAFGSTIILVHVVERIRMYSAESAAVIRSELDIMDKRKSDSRRMLENLKSEFETLGLTVETNSLEGDVPHELLDFIKATDADLVILGSHGVKGIRQFTLGSVVSRITHHVDKSVMIVR